MPSRLPYSQRCEDCGAQKLPYSALCARCKARKERSFGAPGRAVAIPPSSGEGQSGVSVARPHVPHSSPEHYPVSQQERDLFELSTCPYCGTPWGGHSVSCWGRIEDLDSRGFEYAPDEGEAL